MEDYLDKKIRALIVEMIYEDVAEKEKSKVGTPEEYRPNNVLLGMFAKVFTVGGLASLIVAGLFFEKDFTKATLSSLGDASLDIFNAFKAAFKAPYGRKLSTLLSIGSNQSRSNMYEYLREIKNIQDTSPSANAVSELYQMFKRTFSLEIDEPSSDDFAIYEAFMSNNMQSVFTSDAFEVNENNQFVLTKPDTFYTKTLDKKIFTQIKEASNTNLTKQARSAAIGVAYDTYNAAVEMSVGPDELGVTSLIVLANQTEENQFFLRLLNDMGDAWTTIEDFNNNVRDIFSNNNN